jgi:hypothetical protein
MRGRQIVWLIALSGITVKWLPFHSHVYPYSIRQPSSYRHEVIQDTANQQIDYFFPSLGSSVTNVNIYCDGTNANTVKRLEAIGGSHVHRSAWLTVMGKHYPVIYADFSSYNQYWTLEQVTIPVQGHVCHLTASYSHKYRNQRAIMMKMLATFKFT